MNIIFEFKNVPIECAVRHAWAFCAVVSQWLSEGSVHTCSPDVVNDKSYVYHSVPGRPTTLDVVTLSTHVRWPDSTFAVLSVDELQRLFVESPFYECSNSSKVVFVAEERTAHTALAAVVIIAALAVCGCTFECWDRRRQRFAHRHLQAAVAPEVEREPLTEDRV